MAYGTVNRYGSGFQDGAALVSSAPSSVWWPQTSHPYGSNPGRVLAHTTTSSDRISRPAMPNRTLRSSQSGHSRRGAAAGAGAGGEVVVVTGAAARRRGGRG